MQFPNRKLLSICGRTDPYIWILKVSQDAHDAKSYLSKLSFVDQNRIAIMGWSQGAGTILKAIDAAFHIENRGNPFRAAIAFYPYCHNTLVGFEAPLLILIGEMDGLTPADLCQRQMVQKPGRPEVVLKIYPDASHGFDGNFYHDDAADAVVQVKSFLSKHMR